MASGERGMNPVAMDLENCWKEIGRIGDSNLLPQLSGPVPWLGKRKLCATVSVFVRSFLTLFQTTNLRHFQTERVCRRQFQIR